MLYYILKSIGAAGFGMYLISTINIMIATMIRH